VNQDLEARMNELETRQAFQDDTLQTLNDVLISQQQQIDRLQRQLDALAARQEVLQGQLDQEVIEPPPPHY
jgi:SlyX protein